MNTYEFKVTIKSPTHVHPDDMDYVEEYIREEVAGACGDRHPDDLVRVLLDSDEGAMVEVTRWGLPAVGDAIGLEGELYEVSGVVTDSETVFFISGDGEERSTSFGSIDRVYKLVKRESR